MVGDGDPLTLPIKKRSAPEPSPSNVVHEKKMKLAHTSVDSASHAHLGSLDNASQSSHNVVPDVLEPEEDDRFFGGGLSEQQVQAMNYLASKDQEEEGPMIALDGSGIRKIAAQFERAITKNHEMRTRHSEDPVKFLESEADLDKQIKQLSVLSEYPALYEEFVNMNCLTSLVGLISHENSDVAFDAVQIITELTDEETNATEEQFSVLVDALKSCQAFDILVQNLDRLIEDNEVDRETVFQTLTLIENVVNIDPSMKIYLFQQAKILPWLLTRLEKKELDRGVTQNKQYAAELLSILIQDSIANIEQLIDVNGVDSFLVLLAPYRKLSPEKNSLEEEYLGNLFDTLDILIANPTGKDKFLEGEGVELMQRVLIDAKSHTIRHRALQAIEYGCGSWSGGAVCAQAVEVGLLRSLFSTFIKKDDLDWIKTCLGIFVSFFRTLNDGEPERVRFLNKFLENGHQKIVRLFDFRSQFDTKHSEFLRRQKIIDDGRPEPSENEKVEYDLTRYLDRLENGLDGLQMIDVILAWLIASDESAKAMVMSHAHPSVEEIRATLIELRESIKSKEELDTTELDISGQRLEQQQEHEMLQALVDALSTPMN